MSDTNNITTIDIENTTTADIIIDTTAEDATADNEPVMSKLNHILYLQDTIKTECKSILDLQSKTDDPKQYVEHQALLNSLFVQHMELGLKATSLIAAESLKSSDSTAATIALLSLSTESSCCDDSVELTARDSLLEASESAGVAVGRTLSVADEATSVD